MTAPICPYCGDAGGRAACIEEATSRGVLPACAVGPRADAPEPAKREGYGCGFLILWAYLMLLSIALAPAIAMAIKAWAEGQL